MRVAYLVAGAGGMYCGSCMHDNRLAAALIAQGRDVVLIPLYTPLRTDEPDVSGRRIFFGGVNVYLQHAFAPFRHTPAVFDRLLDARGLLRFAGRYASRTQPEDLGSMTTAMLQGESGPLRKELRKLVAALRQIKPELVYLPNALFVGLAPPLKLALDVPVLCGLVGEDIFLDRLPEPHRANALWLLQTRAANVDGFIALTDYYARCAIKRFALPAARVHRIRMGIHAADFAGGGAPAESPFTIGYLARICPEKGLHALAEAFVHLRRSGRDCRLRIAGYLGDTDRAYAAQVAAALRQAGVGDHVAHVGEVNRPQKAAFLQSLHALAVPTTYVESKGFYVLEALAAGVPVVLPDHGSFPELIDATGGGLLHKPLQPQYLADSLARLMDDPTLRQRLATAGRTAVHKDFTTQQMATEAWAIFERAVAGNSA